MKTDQCEQMAGISDVSINNPSDIFDGRINNSPMEITDSATVFQCDKCLSILGDSSSYLEMQEDVGVVVLKSDSCSSSASLKIAQGLSKDAIPGLKGMSKKAFCAKCTQQVGAVYVKSLPSTFAHLKDCLCLQVDNITSYNIPAAPASPALNNVNLVSTLTYTIQEIAKLKHVILNFNERLLAIERSLEDEST